MSPAPLRRSSSSPGLRRPANLAPVARLAALVVALSLGRTVAWTQGALFSGIASTGLHGWRWFFAAFPGSAAGTRLRPAFGLKG